MFALLLIVFIPLGHGYVLQPRHTHFSNETKHSASHTSSLSNIAYTSTPPSSSPSTSSGLDPNASNCRLALPANALTPEGLSTPWKLLPPCSQQISTQQSFAEAAVYSDGSISIYHPLIIDQDKTPQATPVVPNLDPESQIALFFGFNGDVLTLVDENGRDANSSPILKKLQCVNGLPGIRGDVFGQVSWCATSGFWNAVNTAVANNELVVPLLGNDEQGNQCPSTHSFEIVDQDQSDNLPTKYLLLSDGSTVQFNSANQARFPTATEIDNASDEALIADFIDPIIGCTPFKVKSIDDPGSMVGSLATQELQARIHQQQPIALVPLNDPDTLLTASGKTSRAKTNAYRIGVNMPELGTTSGGFGSPTHYCRELLKVQPPFLANFQAKFTQAATPDPTIGNNLFTFLSNRFLQSLVNLKCDNRDMPVKCILNTAGVATSCTIKTHNPTPGNQTASPAQSP